MPENNSWLTWADFTPSILNGGSAYAQFSSDDWKDATFWLKQNTSEDAIIASWWDYGYWITTLSDRTTLADNATLIDWQIQKMAYALITTPDKSWHILSSHYTEDITEYLGDDVTQSFGGMTTEDYSLFYARDYQSEKMFQGIYEEISDDERNLVDNYLAENSFPVCEQIFKNEAQKLNVKEQTCNPISKGMDADYLVIFIVGCLLYTSPSPRDS